jgi:hypothetical protein
VTITRAGHAFEGRPLGVISRLKRRGEPLLLVELPDGSRTYIPVAWTDLGGEDGDATGTPASEAGIGRLEQFLHLRALVDALLARRGESPAADEEKRHATEAEISRRRQRAAARPTCLGEAGRRGAGKGAGPARRIDRADAGSQGGRA